MAGSALTGFSYQMAREAVPADGVEIVLTAPEKAREQLQERFDLERLSKLTATMVISPWKKSGVKVEGRLTADLAQKCVVTLDPVPAELDETFLLLFRPEVGAQGKEQEIAVDPLADEPPDILPPEGIDLGEAVAEQLALLLDPYPKAPGASFQPENDGDSTEVEENEGKPNPFSVLKNLKSGKDDPH